MSEVDHDAETQVGATELGVAIEATGPQLAYSAELEVVDYPEPASRARVAVIAGGIVLAAGLVVGGVLIVGRGRHEAPTPVAATTTTVAPVAAPPPPPPPPAVTVTTVIVQSTVAPKKAPPPPPQAARVQSMWTYDVQWGGGPGISVIEYGSAGPRQSYVVNGGHLGMGNGWTGELIGVDPILEGPLTWASCTLYVNGQVAKTSFAARGDGNDVSCLIRLTR